MKEVMFKEDFLENFENYIEKRKKEKENKEIEAEETRRKERIRKEAEKKKKILLMKIGSKKVKKNIES